MTGLRTWVVRSFQQKGPSICGGEGNGVTLSHVLLAKDQPHPCPCHLSPRTRHLLAERML